MKAPELTPEDHALINKYVVQRRGPKIRLCQEAVGGSRPTAFRDRSGIRVTVKPFRKAARVAFTPPFWMQQDITRVFQICPPMFDRSFCKTCQGLGFQYMDCPTCGCGARMDPLTVPVRVLPREVLEDPKTPEGRERPTPLFADLQTALEDAIAQTSESSTGPTGHSGESGWWISHQNGEWCPGKPTKDKSILQGTPVGPFRTRDEAAQWRGGNTP